MKGRKEATARYAMIKSKTADQPWELYTTLLQAFPEGSFYDQPESLVEAVRESIRSNDPVFVAKLAVYLREQKEQRSLAFVLLAELGLQYGDTELVRSLTARIVKEAGEIPEWLGYYTRVRGGGSDHKKNLRLPARLRKSLAPIWNLLDEYRFGRYSREEQEKIRQALAVIRPAANSRVKKLFFARVLQGAIAVRSTWASEWQALQEQVFESPEAKQSALRDKWKEGISSFRIGYGALLKNLQPILAAGVSGKVLKLAAEYISHPAAVAGSRTSPLRLLEAYRKLKGRREGGVPLLLEALEQAAEHSARLMGFAEQNSLVIAIDVSNSMKHPLQEGSCIQRYDIGPLLALLLKGRSRSLTTGIIGNTWKPVDLTTRGILAGVDPFHRREGEAGYALNAHLVIQDLLKKRQVEDKVMIFTDCRLWDSRPFHQSAGADLVRAWREYREMAPDARLYLFDLAGYGHQPLENPEEGVYLVSGWQDRIFELLTALEDKDATLAAIQQIEL